MGDHRRAARFVAPQQLTKLKIMNKAEILGLLKLISAVETALAMSAARAPDQLYENLHDAGVMLTRHALAPDAAQEDAS